MERLEDGVRSTPIGRPTSDDGEGTLDEVGSDYRIEQDVEIGENTVDLL